MFSRIIDPFAKLMEIIVARKAKKKCAFIEILTISREAQTSLKPKHGHLRNPWAQ